MNVKSFFVAALSSALDLGLATPDDVLKHVTPDLLAEHLPRPLWARLLTACLGAPRVDAQLVVDTIGVPNLCEHVPAPTIWRCIEDIGARALGGVASVAIPAAPAIVTRTVPAAPPKPLAVSAPPPEEKKKPAAAAAAPVPAGPSIPAPTTGGATDQPAEHDSSENGLAGTPLRPRTATSQRFRQTNTNIGRLAASSAARRPQAAVPTPVAPVSEPATPASHVRRGMTESDLEMETAIAPATNDDWKSALAVEDEQLIDWSGSEELTATNENDPRSRKR